jgi:NADPH-dependent glutamate synthase beta subunit-like oxidoreductase
MKRNAFGMKMGKPFKDRDGDLTPDLIDCRPLNPRRQGVKEWLSEKMQRYKEAGTPEGRQKRHEERIENLQRKSEVAKLKQGIEETRASTEKTRMGVQRERMGVQRERIGIMRQRQEAIPKMPSMFGSPSTSGQQVSAPITQTRRTKKGKAKRKAQQTEIVYVQQPQQQPPRFFI